MMSNDKELEQFTQQLQSEGYGRSALSQEISVEKNLQKNARRNVILEDVALKGVEENVINKMIIQINI